MSTVVEQAASYKMTLDELQRLEKLETESPAQARQELADLQRRDYAAWGEFICWARDDDHFRQKRVAADERERMEVARQARQARQPKPAPQTAAQPAPGERGSGFVRFRNLQKFAAAVGKTIRAARAETTAELTGKLANAERVEERNRELETRVLQLEKRVAGHDSRHDAHARHLRGIEGKIGPLVLAAKKEEASQ